MYIAIIFISLSIGETSSIWIMSFSLLVVFVIGIHYQRSRQLSKQYGQLIYHHNLYWVYIDNIHIFSVNLRIVYMCLSWNVKKPKNNCQIETSVILLPVAQHESGTRKTIFWSVTVNSKHFSSQSNLTTQI